MARKSKKIRDDRPFPFLKLPAELRNRIYDLALTSPKRVILTSRFRKHSRRHLAYRVRSKILKAERDLLIPNLLRASKQIYNESLPVLYNQRIEFEDPSALFYFLSQIGQDAIKSIRNIRLVKLPAFRRSDVTQPAFSLLVHATNLATLSVDHLATNDALKCGEAPLGAKSFFEAAHVWVEHMERNKNKGGTDWRDVIIHDEEDKARIWYKLKLRRVDYVYESVPYPACSIEKFREDIEKLLEE